MNISQQFANQLEQFFFGGNWTSVSVKQVLEDISCEEASKTHPSFDHTIVQLAYHINYYVKVVLPVFDGKPLEAKDAYSYDHPPITNENDWLALLQEFWNNAMALVAKVAAYSTTKWEADFVAEKYGSYARNIIGIIEHGHYHLGQIVLLKKALRKIT